MARLEELERKFEENPRRYFAPLANEYRKAGDALRAADVCRAQLQDVPGHISGHIVLGQALYDARDFDGSRAALETALALDPENIVALRYLGDIARDTGDAAEAERWYSRTLEADPYNEAATAALQALRAAPADEPPQPLDDAVMETPEFQIDTEALAAGFEPTSHVEPESPETSETSETPPESSQGWDSAEAIELPDGIDVVPPLNFGDAGPPESPSEPEVADQPQYGETELPVHAAPQLETQPSDALTVTGEFAGDLSVSAVSETEAGNDELAAALETTEPAADEPVEPEPAAEEPIATVPAEERFDVAAHAPPEPEAPEEPIQAEERVLESAAPFVTETMADLYLEQGYPHEALELLLQLSEQRPQDEQLRAKIEHIESVIVARRDVAVAAARAERAEAAASAEATVEDSVEAVAEVAEPDEPVSVRELFARMDRVRPRGASSVTPRPISRRRSDFVPMPEGAATADDASDDPFAFPSPPAPVARTSGPHQTFNPSTADTEDFNAWLRGLRGP